MDDVTFLARVQAHLDARRDPLDDADVVAFVDAHPERLAEFATLRADARELARSAAATRRPARRYASRYSWLTAAAAVAGLASMLLPTRQPTPPAGRIVAGSLHEQRPRAHAAATFTVNEALVSTATTRWQTWQYRSEPR